MLFLIKNDYRWSLVVSLLFAIVAYHGLFKLPTGFIVTPGFEIVRDVFLSGLAFAGSDGLLHGFLLLALGNSYRSRYRALAEFFRFQGSKEILAGGLLAAAEEMVFRALLLEGLVQRAGWRPGWAVGVSAIVFGLCHLIPSRTLWPFVFWAIWEGVLLGAVYVLSGSLLVSMIVHSLHDIAGFSLFAYQRRQWGKKAA